MTMLQVVKSSAFEALKHFLQAGGSIVVIREWVKWKSFWDAVFTVLSKYRDDCLSVADYPDWGRKESLPM